MDGTSSSKISLWFETCGISPGMAFFWNRDVPGKEIREQEGYGVFLFV